MADNFFSDSQDQNLEQSTEQVIDKIKLGDQEYSQEELQKLVGLGKIGLEAEQKYKTRLDRVWPQFQTVINEKRDLDQKFTQTSAEKEELQRKLRDLEGRQTTTTQQQLPQQAQTEQFTSEMKEQALKQLKELNTELGYIPREEARKIAMEVLQGQNLINDVMQVIDDMKTDGLPDATVEDMLKHMDETGIRNPQKAYKDMFEKEYLEKQVEKLSQIKRPNGLPTISQSTAGAKQPPSVKITKDNLEQLLGEALRESFQQ